MLASLLVIPYLFLLPSSRSVASITNNFGDVVNRYTYDPFGNIVTKTEIVENMFLYNGKWGVRALFGFDDIYIMRSRMYHAKYGNFMSLDSYGFAGKSTNLYCYVLNNPIAGN